MSLLRYLHPASDLPVDSGESWSRDQVCHPQEEARWTCKDCGGRGCSMCDHAGVLMRGDDRFGTRYVGEDPRGSWLPTTPAQRDSLDGRTREVCE